MTVTFIDKTNVCILRDHLSVNMTELLNKNYAVLDSYVSEEMAHYKKSLPYERLEIASLIEGFENLGLTYRRVDPSEKGFIRQLDDIDFAFLNLYGDYGEDGRVQGMLDLLGIAYNGSGVTGSALNIDKLISKTFVRSLGHRTPDYMSNRMDTSNTLTPPVMVKTYRGGSSIRMEYYGDTVPEKIDSDCFIEAFIDGKIITVSFIEHEGDIFILPPVEVITEGSRFYDKEAKINRSTEYSYPKLDSACRLSLANLMTDLCRFAGIKGYARVDMMLKDKELYYLETNTIPGILKQSNMALAFAKAGVDYQEMLTMIITASWRGRTGD